MKKTNIAISYDEEKVTAARLYLKQKNMKLEEELAKAMDVLYTKSVPANVRDFIDMRTGIVIEMTGTKGMVRREDKNV